MSLFLLVKLQQKEPSHFFSIIHSHYVYIDNRAIFQNGASSLVPTVQPKLSMYIYIFQQN